MWGEAHRRFAETGNAIRRKRPIAQQPAEDFQTIRWIRFGKPMLDKDAVRNRIALVEHEPADGLPANLGFLGLKIPKYECEVIEMSSGSVGISWRPGACPCGKEADYEEDEGTRAHRCP